MVRSEADRLSTRIFTTENEWVEDAYQQSDFSRCFTSAPPGKAAGNFA